MILLGRLGYRHINYGCQAECRGETTALHCNASHSISIVAVNDTVYYSTLTGVRPICCYVVLLATSATAATEDTDEASSVAQSSPTSAESTESTGDFIDLRNCARLKTSVSRMVIFQRK